MTATVTGKNPWSPWTIVSILGAVAVVCAGLLWPNATAATTEDDKQKSTLSISQEMIDALTVTSVSDDAQCALDSNGLVAYQIGAFEGIPPRIASDAPSTPFVASEPEDVRDELQQSVCEDPLLGVAYATFYATDVRDRLLAATGFDILSVNPWLQPFAVETSKISVLAAEFIPLLDVVNPSDELVLEAHRKNLEWQQLAPKIGTLFDKFQLDGIQALTSEVNYHLVAGGLVVGSLPAVERNPNQESLPALILSLTEKDQCEPLLVIGANIGDKRPELFATPSCETAPPPPPPTCTSNCEPVTPPCKTNCGPPNTPKGDSPQPDGKPKEKETPPSTTEPEVITEQPGGGGVVDTPTNPPGSETGGTAPGATKPNPAPTTPPTNEGGSNDGTVTPDP